MNKGHEATPHSQRGKTPGNSVNCTRHQHCAHPAVLRMAEFQLAIDFSVNDHVLRNTAGFFGTIKNSEHANRLLA